MESFLTQYGLSNSGEEKLQFTPFSGGPKPGCPDSVRALRQLKRGEALFPPVHNKVTMYAHCAMSFFCIFRMPLFFGLTSYAGEIAYFNSPNPELSTGVRVMALY